MRKNEKNYPQKASQLQIASNEEVNYEEVVNSLLENDDIDHMSYISLLRLNEFIPIYQSHCLKQKKYQKAKQLLDLQQKITAELTKQTKQLREYNEKNAISIEFASIQTNKESKSPELKKFDIETQQKENQMKSRQKQILNQFEEIWKTKVSIEYAQDSKQLQSLKQEHKKLYSIGLKANAAELQDQISQLEEEEANESQKKYEQDYKKAKIHLFEKFEIERITFRKDRQRQRSMLVSRIQRNVPITRPKLTSLFSCCHANSSLTNKRPIKRSIAKPKSVLNSYSISSTSLKKSSSSSSLESTKAVYGIKMNEMHHTNQSCDGTNCQAKTSQKSVDVQQSESQSILSASSQNSKNKSDKKDEQLSSTQIDEVSYDEISDDEEFVLNDRSPQNNDTQAQIVDLNTYHDDTMVNASINDNGFAKNINQNEKFDYEYDYDYN